MSDPNEPRVMPRRGNAAEPRVFDDLTGDAGKDGYTRIARRNVPGRGDTPGYGSGGISPEVGERDWSHGPRYEEDC